MDIVAKGLLAFYCHGARHSPPVIPVKPVGRAIPPPRRLFGVQAGAPNSTRMCWDTGAVGPGFSETMKLSMSAKCSIARRSREPTSLQIIMTKSQIVQFCQ